MLRIRHYIHLARPHQFLKNGFVWLPLFFGFKLHDSQAILQVLYAFAVFCAASGSIYAVNDVVDVDEDRKHPQKKTRPLAKGEISKPQALVFSCFLMLLALIAGGLLLPIEFLAIISAYLLVNVAYSCGLKKLALFDIVCIAVGFLLRVFGGGIAGGTPVSRWLIMMTFLMALFLALAKRRDDILLKQDGLLSRPSLSGYNLEFVSLGMVTMASVIIVFYILYTVSPEIMEKHGTDKLYLTGFWVIMGLLRYMQITFVLKRSGSPTRVMLKDFLLQVIVVLWILNVYFLIY